jgi:hypothetical protein
MYKGNQIVLEIRTNIMKVSDSNRCNGYHNWGNGRNNLLSGGRLVVKLLVASSLRF